MRTDSSLMRTSLHSQPPEIETRRPSASDRRFSRLKESVGERLGLLIGACVSLILFLRFAAYGTRRLWYDEVSTAIVALQPSWIDVWKAFAAGVDAQPPLFSYITRISWLLLGRNELALRIPEILGIILFSWCMFFFVRRRLGTVFGLSAMILPLLTDLVFYAGEARPYGMLLGACGLALLAWRNAIENPQRRLALPLFAASLTLIVSLHAYAIIAVLMFVLTEAARYVWTRKSKPAVMGLFSTSLAAAVDLLVSHAVGKNGRGVLGRSEWATWHTVPWFYEYYFHDRILLLILLGLLTIGLLLLRAEEKPRTTRMPWFETFLAGTLAVAPVFSVAVAVFVTRYYRPRYSIFAIAGCPS